MGRLRTVLMALAAFLVALPGCVELAGQRITLKYDEAADRLVLFISYDGIHDNEKKGNEKGAEQLREFVRHGDLMVLDWFGHVEWKRLRKDAQDPKVRPAARELARLTVTTVETKAVGHYTDPGGRVGALQRVVIPAASRYLRQVNLAIDEAVLAAARERHEFGNLQDEMPRTFARMEAAARSGHRWITLDRSALRLSFPVHSREWARAKAEFLDNVSEALAESTDTEDSAEARSRWIIQLLVAGPLSVVERDGNVEITFGDGGARTSRFVLRHRYDGSMEKAVKMHVPERLDAAIAARLLGDPLEDVAGSPGVDRALSDFLRWGPPEDKVRAVLAVASGGDEDERGAADAWLARFAARWNVDEGYPTAPTNPADHDHWVREWTKWYARMLAFPLEGSE